MFPLHLVWLSCLFVPFAVSFKDICVQLAFSIGNAAVFYLFVTAHQV